MAIVLGFGVIAKASVLIVVLALVIMIFLHELGHYLTAKWAGMKVTEFFLGFGPALVVPAGRDRVRPQGASPPGPTCGSSG